MSSPISSQLPLFAPAPPSPHVSAAVEALAAGFDARSRGAVFTRPEVVDFILDLVGYTADLPLHHKRLLEPSFGGGEFLLRAIERLLVAWRTAGGEQNPLLELGNAIRAVELHRETFLATHSAVLERLAKEGMADSVALELAGRWLVQGDFLLEPLAGTFDFVVGNPPYVRQELIPGALLAEYRSRYPTLYDRADLYIPFIERSLLALAEGGSLCFICANRWMKNKYGGPLRRLVARDFHLRVYVDMVDTPAFHGEVSAYPAITVITREPPGLTRIAHRPPLDGASLSLLSRELRGEVPTNGGGVRQLAQAIHEAEPWLLDGSDETALLRRLEHCFPLLEETGCKVGIGVATGADQAFIGDFATLDVEPDRKLRLVTTTDIRSGEVAWQGHGIINPFADDGSLVNLEDYPRLTRYLEARRAVIARRHCALKSPTNWYRTIDRISPALTERPKLLIPDIKGESHVVFERGHLYPHHNLYYVISDTWDLRALQAVLLSSIARLFVASYSTKMRGGYLRFQAQYLRRIRVPYWRGVPDGLRRDLIAAAERRDFAACDRAAADLYGLTIEERSVLENR